jgi:hypothetical protein
VTICVKPKVHGEGVVYIHTFQNMAKKLESEMDLLNEMIPTSLL